ncbi:MAG: zf-HC2 domain-containing protein [Actinobacteria bacterium]|nr:zf-HC2 domain-containing protein [Actinomycetota bacterium]
MTPARSQRETRALLGAYVLDAVDEAERQQVEAHLEGCAACRRELARLREAADMLPSPSRPPEELWRRIVAEVQAVEDEGRGANGGQTATG